MIYELYIATIALLCSGILFGVLSALLAIVNTAYNPSEAICHIPGKEQSSLYMTIFDNTTRASSSSVANGRL
jgi:hypothetical protein